MHGMISIKCRVNFVIAVVFCSRSTVGHSKQKCYVLTCKSEYSQELLVGSSVHNLVIQHLWQDMWFLLWCCWRCSSSVMWCEMQWPWKWRHIGNYTPNNTASNPRRPGSLSCLLLALDLCVCLVYWVVVGYYVFSGYCRLVTYYYWYIPAQDEGWWWVYVCEVINIPVTWTTDTGFISFSRSPPDGF
jgi:hypothetical protein